MKIVFIRGLGAPLGRKFRLFSFVVGLGTLIVFGGAMLSVGYQLGLADAEFPEHQLVRSLKATFDAERRMLQDARSKTGEQVDALALRVGRLQAQLLRLDALGQRLVEVGKLDRGEFDFTTKPAMGGPQGGENETAQQAIPGLLQELAQLESKIESRQQQLVLLEDLILNSNLEQALHPTGRPISKGWISSYYGMRNDPFTGKRAMHKGMDFAGKKGSNVIAVAAGVVTKAEQHHGYGLLVEINHGKGYVTRYGHNEEILVAVGDRVKQGQAIGKMGSSGRSTGPHVHFEVLRHGKVVDPTRYIRKKREQDKA